MSIISVQPNARSIPNPTSDAEPQDLVVFSFSNRRLTSSRYPARERTIAKATTSRCRSSGTVLYRFPNPRNSLSLSIFQPVNQPVCASVPSSKGPVLKIRSQNGPNVPGQTPKGSKIIQGATSKSEVVQSFVLRKSRQPSMGLRILAYSGTHLRPSVDSYIT